MNKFLTVIAVLGLALGMVEIADAKGHDNGAQGKAVGQQDRADDSNGASGNAPGKTGDTGKDNAPGQQKKGGGEEG